MSYSIVLFMAFAENALGLGPKQIKLVNNLWRLGVCMALPMVVIACGRPSEVVPTPTPITTPAAKAEVTVDFLLNEPFVWYPGGDISHEEYAELNDKEMEAVELLLGHVRARFLGESPLHHNTPTKVNRPLSSRLREWFRYGESRDIYSNGYVYVQGPQRAGDFSTLDNRNLSFEDYAVITDSSRRLLFVSGRGSIALNPQDLQSGLGPNIRRDSNNLSVFLANFDTPAGAGKGGVRPGSISILEAMFRDNGMNGYASVAYGPPYSNIQWRYSLRAIGVR